MHQRTAKKRNEHNAHIRKEFYNGIRNGSPFGRGRFHDKHNVHIVRNEKLYHNRTHEIKGDVVGKEYEKHCKAHTERVDNQKDFSSESVGKRTVDQSQRLKRHHNHGQQVKHGNRACAEIRHQIVSNFRFHKGAYLGGNFIGCIDQCCDKHNVCKVCTSFRSCFLFFPFFDFFLSSCAYFRKFFGA